MIDLDDQLTAYGDYLDNVERQIIVLRPEPPAQGCRSYRRGVTIAAACALAIGGVVGIGVTRLGGTGPSTISTAQSERLHWRLVPGTEDAFEPILNPPPLGSTSVSAVVDSSYGLLAVGYETDERQHYDLGDYFVPAVWQSDDGQSWRRLEHAPSFGEFADNGRMYDVAEYDGRVVAIGEAHQGRTQAWRTDDLADWSSVSLGRPSGYDDNWYTVAVALAAGPQGYVAVGTVFTNHKDAESGQSNASVWYSEDGTEWSSVYVEPSGGRDSDITGVVAAADGFVAVGTANGGPATWTSSNGRNWQRVDMPTNLDGLRFTGLVSIVQDDGEFIATGTTRPRGSVHGWVPAIWVSQDGTTWQGRVFGRGYDEAWQTPAGLVAYDSAIVAFVVDEDDDGYKVVEFSSDDGTAWSARTVGLPGIPAASTSFDDGAVVIADPAWLYDLEPWTPGSRPTVWIAG